MTDEIEGFVFLEDNRMGKKTMKKSEEKPSHKWRLNIHKTPVVAGKKEQKKSWRERRQEKLEGLLQLGLDRNDESVLRLEKEIKDISRQRVLARKLVKVPINMSLAPHFCKELNDLLYKMIFSARENVPEAVLGLLRDRLMDKFGRSYKRFVYHLWEHMWLKVHLRCLQEDAGLSDEGMAKMHPLHLLKLLDGVNNTHTPSVERKMKVLVREFGLHTPCSYPVQDIITELVEKMVKAFAKVAPHDAKVVFAKVAHDDAMAHEMDLSIRGISLAK